uniref:Uncharacterized protein n=1 Tax=Arundo donax TaxID=35708 RepID=A0A0A9GWZ7_ARUDO
MLGPIRNIFQRNPNKHKFLITQNIEKSRSDTAM